MYRKNVSQSFDFNMVTPTGAADAAATVAARRILDGIGFTSCVGNIINRGAGGYSLIADSSDVNGNTVGLQFTAAGDVPLMLTFPTTAANPTDAVSFGITRLDSTISSRMGATPLINNLSNLDSAVSSRMGTFTLPLNFASLGLSSSGHVSNVDTLMIYTSNTPQSGNAFPNVNTGVAPGAAGGLFISGSNAGQTTIGSLVMGSGLSIGNAFRIVGNMVVNGTTTFTGTVAYSNGVNITAGTNTHALVLFAAGGDGLRTSGMTSTGSVIISDLNITGTVAFGGAFTATNAGNDIRGITIATSGIDVGDITAGALNAIADALLDRADAIETGITPRLAQRYGVAALAGVLSGAATTTVAILGAGVGTTRITATVDANGNRSVIVLS